MISIKDTLLIIKINQLLQTLSRQTNTGKYSQLKWPLSKIPKKTNTKNVNAFSHQNETQLNKPPATFPKTHHNLKFITKLRV